MSRDQKVRMLLPIIEKCPIGFYQGVLLLPKFDSSSHVMIKSCDYEVMLSVPPEVEPFEWGLPAVQIWCFWLLRNCRYIDFQIDHFDDFEYFKIDSQFADFGRVKIGFSSYFYLLWAGHSCFTSLGKMLDCKKQSKPSPFDKKLKNQA